MATVVAAVAGPCLLMAALIAADIRMDLSELRPTRSTWADGVALVGWPELPEIPRQRVRMLGYMMDSHPPAADGTPVDHFLLMPDAGHIFHPAHRIREEMVLVRLAEGMPVPYADRGMVWVEGLLRKSDGQAAYAITQATVARADEHAVAAWFAFRR